jgi:hypothetical protein
MKILSAMNDVNQDQEAISGAQPVEVGAGELSRLQQLIILPGEEGGIITQNEYLFSKFCALCSRKAEEKNICSSRFYDQEARLSESRHSCGNHRLERVAYYATMRRLS